MMEQGFSFGKFVLDCLPVPPSQQLAGIILDSALVIELMIVAHQHMLDTNIFRHYIEMAALYLTET